MNLCPCGSGVAYSDCCEVYISGKRAAPTAEALMRSRYTAYVNKEISYLEETLTPQEKADFSAAETLRWAENSEWIGLEVSQTEGGSEGDKTGIVGFSARFKNKGEPEEKVHHEIGKFVKQEGRWYYAGHVSPKGQTVKREEPKIGRNDPCTCGSGKKFKKCCGK